MGVEVKSGGEGVIVADRGCNDGCCCNGRNSGWGSGWGAVGGALVGGALVLRHQERSTGNQVSYREHC